jgi:arginyl-tRNA synthetase
MKAKLELMIQEAVQAVFGISDIACSLEHADLGHGDYATNAALVVSKRAGEEPKVVAEKLIEHLSKTNDPMIRSIASAGPGFINITLSPAFFSDVLIKAQQESWGRNMIASGKKIVVEHSSPNLFKPFHVGHVMNNTIGESIVRLAQYSGAAVTAVSYPSDVGLGIGKTIWVLLQDGAEKLDTLKTIPEQLAYLGECYVRGTKAHEENENIQKEVRGITKQLYEHTPGPALEVYEKGKKINLEYFLAIVERLGSRFDAFIYESEAGTAGAAIVRKNIPDVFEESDGAVIYRGEQDGLHTRVFINTDGYPTYEAKDIGLLSLKFDRYSPDISILITDHQQTSYYEVVLAAAGKINPAWKECMVHRTHGRMGFKGQKMSSRLGGIPTAQSVLDTVVEEVSERSADLSSESKEIIAIGALKFVILRAMAGKNINFDPDSSLSFEGDSGPYLQYTAVRAASVLAKAKDAGIVPMISESNDPTNVERIIARFPDIIERSTNEWAPHHIVGYLLELAQSFNSWYGNTKIIDESNGDTPHRLAITQALSQTIRNGLWLLGINTPEKM